MIKERNRPEILAFTPEAIEEMNKNIIELNDGIFHQPIFKVRVFEKELEDFRLDNRVIRKINM
jgi:CRISPR-associated endonuclease Csn1